MFSEATKLNINGYAERALQLYRKVKEIDPHYQDIDLLIRGLEKEISEGLVTINGRIDAKKIQKKTKPISFGKLSPSLIIGIIAFLAVFLSTLAGPYAVQYFSSIQHADTTITPVFIPTGTSQPPPPPPTEPPQPAAQEFFTESFEGDISNWKPLVELNATDGDISQANIYVEDGHLIFDMGKWLIGYVFYEPFEYSNVRIEVRVDNRGNNVNNVLLLCRVSDEGHYLVNIANGLYNLYAYDGATNNYANIANGGTNKIKTGKEVNEYTLVCNDRTLTLFVNGYETHKYTDNKYVFREGLVGVGVASEQFPVRLEFDWVQISEP